MSELKINILVDILSSKVADLSLVLLNSMRRITQRDCVNRKQSALEGVRQISAIGGGVAYTTPMCPAYCLSDVRISF